MDSKSEALKTQQTQNSNQLTTSIKLIKTISIFHLSPKPVSQLTRFDALRGEADRHEGPYEGDQPNGDGVGQIPAAVVRIY